MYSWATTTIQAFYRGKKTRSLLVRRLAVLREGIKNKINFDTQDEEDLLSETETAIREATQFYDKEVSTYDN